VIERQKIAGDPRESFARWIRDDGTERLVPATTMCWRPRYPQMRRAYRQGSETVLRCGDCPGCREFEVLRLERRLVATYRSAEKSRISRVDTTEKFPDPEIGNRSGRLFAVRVYCRREIHAAMSRQIHRWRGVEIEPGFFRAGVESFVVLSSSPAELVERLRRRRFQLDVRPIGRLDRARSWRDVARGLIVPRSAYGEDINRYYRRGLTPAEKEKWKVEERDVYKPFDKATDARVISESHGRLVPPRMWKLQDAVSVDARKRLDRANSPEAVAHVMRELLPVLDRVGNRGSITAVPISDEQKERNRRAYQHVARMEKEIVVNAKPSDHSSPPFVGGVTKLLANSGSSIGQHMSSIHSSGAPPPASRESIKAEAERVEAAEKARTEFIAQRAKKALDASFARLRALAEKVQGK
jgi:hypothetical protein